jgi:ATP-independent RNA helicase DbpA
MESFDQLDLPPALRPGLDALGLTRMTAVQTQALPDLLAGRDMRVQAPTGSGKTVAFGLAVLKSIDLTQAKVQALVLCPTRELADQVGKQLRKLGVGLPNLKLSLLYGGVALQPQIDSLSQHDPHIVVGTPGRIQELIRKKHLHLSRVGVLVLDEADRMLDMGFEEAIREILGKLAQKRQNLLISATFPPAIRSIADALLRDPAIVEVEGALDAPAIEERFYEVELTHKPAALSNLLRAERPESAVVFCNTRQDVNSVAGHLAASGGSALALHGDLEQRDRDEVLLQFSNRSCRVLVASDVAARGLDVEGLALVVNYELPTDADTYRHRPRDATRDVAHRRDRGARQRAAALVARARCDIGRCDPGGGDGHAAHRCRQDRQVATRRHPRCTDRRCRLAGERDRQDRRVPDAVLCRDRARPGRTGVEADADRQDQEPQLPRPPAVSDADTDAARIEARTRLWLERAVIGLNLCPFARAPHVAGRIRYRVSAARDEDGLLEELAEELRLLHATPPEQVETTLLILASVLGDFVDFNQFLDAADACVERLDLDGEIQVASFHPHYRFAGTAPDDVENFSNRSPWPILHLLRESSIARVVDAIEEPDAIYENNIQTLRRLGRSGWDALWRGTEADA